MAKFVKVPGLLGFHDMEKVCSIEIKEEEEGLGIYRLFLYFDNQSYVKINYTTAREALDAAEKMISDMDNTEK